MNFNNWKDLNAHLEKCDGCDLCDEQVDDIGNFEQLSRADGWDQDFMDELELKLSCIATNESKKPEEAKKSQSYWSWLKSWFW